MLARSTSTVIAALLLLSALVAFAAEVTESPSTGPDREAAPCDRKVDEPSASAPAPEEPPADAPADIHSAETAPAAPAPREPSKNRGVRRPAWPPPPDLIS